MTQTSILKEEKQKINENKHIQQLQAFWRIIHLPSEPTQQTHHSGN